MKFDFNNFSGSIDEAGIGICFKKLFIVTYEDGDKFLIRANNLIGAATIVDREFGDWATIEEVIFDDNVCEV